MKYREQRAFDGKSATSDGVRQGVGLWFMPCLGLHYCCPVLKVSIPAP